MKKSINLYFNKDGNAKEKLMKIKQHGFDEFFTGVLDETDLTIKQQVEFACQIGLKCTMIHCSYNEPQLHYFWEEGLNGDKICEDYCKQIKLAKGLTENFVVHLNADKNQQLSKFGLIRLRKMLSLCDECNINLCIENLYSEREIPYIFRYIKHQKLKICFDTGHHHFLTPNFDLLKRYGKFINVLHIHDNNGTKDEHLVCGQGNIDWTKIAKSLKKFPNIVLSAEVKINMQEVDDILKETYQSLCDLERFI